MGAAVAADGSLEMQCQSCHGLMTAVGAATRTGWLDEPSCGNCHTGTAVVNSGQIRYTSALTAAGTRRVPADPTFATNANTPAAGFSLYRFSKGHGGLQCSACHGSTHAEFPAAHPNDNLQCLAHQGHVGTFVDCARCHNASPRTTSGGPHGMHPSAPPGSMRTATPPKEATRPVRPAMAPIIAAPFSPARSQSGRSPPSSERSRSGEASPVAATSATTGRQAKRPIRTMRPS